MKIIYVSNYLPGMHGHAGGAEKAIKQTAEMASSKDHVVRFLTLKGTLKKPNVDFANTIESYVPLLAKFIEILKWYVLQFDPFAYFSARKAFIKHRPDIVHFGNFQFLSFSVLLAAKRLGIPVYISIYDYWYFCPLTTLVRYDQTVCRQFHMKSCVKCLPQKFSMLQKLFLSIRKPIFDHYLKMVDRFIVLSESSRSILIDYGIESGRIKIIRLPAADPKETRTENVTVTRNNILFIGWLQKRKGLHILLQSFKKVLNKIPQARLTILAQDVKWEKDYEKMIASLLVELPENAVVFEKGRRSKEEIKTLIQKASVIAVPEQWENMSPLIVIEAMLNSKAIVASDIGGIPEFIRNSKDGILVKYNDPEDFAEKIAFLLANPEKAREYGLNARERALKLLDQKTIAEELNTEYLTWKQQ